MIELINIEKSFADHMVLDKFSAIFERGSLNALLGRNGTGKTTLFRILMGFLDADAGAVRLNGKPFDRRLLKVGYLPEERGLYQSLSVQDQLRYFASLKGLDQRATESALNFWLERFSLAPVKMEKLKNLSKGNQQKVQIIETLIGDPDLLIWDEPFSGLDPVNGKLLKEVLLDLKKKDKYIIFSSHQMGYVEEIADHIIFLGAGSHDDKAFNKYGEVPSILTIVVHPTVSLAEVFQFLSLPEGSWRGEAGRYEVQLSSATEKNQIFKALVAQDIDLIEFSLRPHRLEDIYIDAYCE